MKEKYYGKIIDLLCPDCGRQMETTSRRGGWSVDCQFMSPLCIIDNDEPCDFDYYKWNPSLHKTEEDAIQAHVTLREEK